MNTTATQSTKKGALLTRILLTLFLASVLFGAGYCGYQLHELSKKQERLKTDYAEMNNIMLGLFSIEQWTGKVEAIVDKQSKELDIDPQQKKQLQKEIEGVIIALINRAEAMIVEPEKKSIRGKLVKFAVKTFVKVDTLKKQVPALARSIMRKVDNPVTKKQLSNMALSKIDELEDTRYIDSTLKANAAKVNKVYTRYQVTNRDDFNRKIGAELKAITKATYTYSIAVLGGIAVFLVSWLVFRKQKQLHTTLFILSLGFAFVLLAVGLTASMIEVDARLGNIDFVLLGQQIIFTDQVLFFQSKSILDVVIILLGEDGADSVAVGVLILIFSVLFPVMKLSATGVHLLGRKSLAESRLICYFAFQSGKWSMADVFVIAILMVYIGLNGLLESQLSRQGINAELLTSISTNNTALQPGYIIFIAFVLFGLLLSTILKFISPHARHN